MKDILGGIPIIGLYLALFACEVYGLILNAADGVGWFVLALVIPPFAVIEGVLGFIAMI